MELVSLRCNRDFTSASSYGLGWYKYAIATQWYQFHTTDAWWFSLIIHALIRVKLSHLPIISISACAKLGTVFSMSFSSPSTVDEIHAASGDGLNFYQILWRPTRQANCIILKKIERFRFHALMVSMDCPVASSCRWKDERNCFEHPSDMRWISLLFNSGGMGACRHGSVKCEKENGAVFA